MLASVSWYNNLSRRQKFNFNNAAQFHEIQKIDPCRALTKKKQIQNNLKVIALRDLGLKSAKIIENPSIVPKKILPAGHLLKITDTEYM